MLTYYCPRCWQSISETPSRCPYCGYDLIEFTSLTYESKLLCAIWHPSSKRRMIAVHILGDLKSENAFIEFSKMISDEKIEDYFLLKELLLAVSKIGGPKSKIILMETSTHTSRLVRNLSNKIIAS